MKRPLNRDQAALQQLIESARQHGDGKSIFGLLLLLEREIRSEAVHSRSNVASVEDQKIANHRRGTVFRSYIE